MISMDTEFIRTLTDQAKSAPRRIVLPEGRDERVLRAAALATAEGVATCLFLETDETLVREVERCGLQFNDGMRSFDVAPHEENYVQRLVALREKKGMTEAQARSMLDDPQIVATLMVEGDEADGLVSGAATVSADVLRPALQLIGKRREERLVSSFFFMCFDQGAKLFADCALNTNPDAEQLAAIAHQSAGAARRFGLEPKVAMLSYSTGSSGSGPSVDLVRKATDIVKQQDPALLVEGPIQYDAAVNPRIAAGKLPGSSVAGQANVLIFPDLDAGNIVYKAVQQAAGVVSVGPIIQGLNRPINDVSRGATVDDIFCTIVTTVIQARDR